jgi:hypothetical protein
MKPFLISLRKISPAGEPISSQEECPLNGFGSLGLLLQARLRAADVAVFE